MHKYANRNIINKSKITYNNENNLSKKEVLGIDITNENKENILEYILKNLQNFKQNYYITTPNPEMIVFANHSNDFKLALNDSKIALCDGIGLLWAAKLLGKPLKERYSGMELMESLCEKVKDWPIYVGFLGAGPKIAEKTAECLVKKYPGLKISYASQEWDEDKIGKDQVESSRYYVVSKKESKSNSPITTRHIYTTKNIDILFVAFGAPKQELWMKEHLNKIPVKVMVGVGGAFDQVVDPSLRPPNWVHFIGIGWLYRLLRQPWRIKRQLRLLEFVWMVIKEKLQ